MKSTPFNITAAVAGPKAEVRITGVIGWDTDSETFRRQIDEIIAKGITEADIYINTPGGSCFDANEIVNILSPFKIKTCRGGALVASAGAFIACSCDTFEMPENGMFMIHKPAGGVSGQSQDLESYLKLLRDIEKDYKSLFASKAKDKREFEKNWSGSADWWMTAKEALAMGFATSIKEKVMYDQEMTSLLKASGCPVNKLTILNQNNTHMNLLESLRNLFGLSDTADEQAVIGRVKPLQDKVTALESEKAALQAKVDGYVTKEKAAQKTEATDLINAALRDGRINAEGKASFEAFFSSDHEGAKTALAAIPVRTPVSSKIETPAQTADKFVKMSWDELDKANLLATLKTSDFELFKEKFKAKFDKEYAE